MGNPGWIRRHLRDGRDLMAFSAVTVLDRALGVLLPLIVAKWFAPDLFGSYSLARMIIFAAAALTLSAAQPSFVIQAGQERREEGSLRRTFWAQGVFLAASLALSLVGLLCLRDQVASFAAIVAGDVVFVFLAYAGLAAKTFACNLLLAAGRRSGSVVGDLVYNALTLALVAAIHLAWGLSIRGVLVCYLLAAGGTLAVAAGLLPLRELWPAQLERASLRRMFDLTKWMVVGSAAAFLIDWGDSAVLRIYVSMADIGTYNVAYPIFKGTLFLAGGVNQYFLPFLCEHLADKEKLRAFLGRKRAVVLGMGLAAIGVLALAAPPAIAAVYGAKYPRAGHIAQILMIGGAMNLYSVFQGTLCYAFGRHRAWQLITVAQLAANLALDFLLAPRWGILGTAIATVIAYALKAALMEAYFRLRLRPLVFA